MAKGNKGGRRNNTPTPPPPVLTGGARTFVNLTDTDAQQIRDMEDSMYNGNVTSAVKMYISGANPNSPARNIDGQGHSLSQTMNFLLEKGEDIQSLTVQQINKKYGLNIDARNYASMQHMNAYMDAGSHAIGKDINLTRLAHDDVLQNEFGIKNYSKYSESQLKSMLVGGTWTSKSYLSTSYDMAKNPFGSNSGQGGGREVVYSIKAGSNTKMLFGNKSQAEIILSKGTNFKITDVKFTGKTATPRLGGTAKQIVIEIETY